MSENVAELKCPRCGAALDAAEANGICPACLLKKAALGTGTDSFPAMPWTPPSVDELASAFPQLEVLELIGHGGMGAVYKARQKSLGRLVALKILAPQHAANPDFAERFAREAKVLAEVSHPNIVTVHDFGQAGEFYFLTMEFVDGVNLRQAMKAGRLTPQQALAIVPPICEALQFAHDRGIVHRDIKPENLLLDKEGRVKIADFGIARMLRVGQAFQPDDLTSNASQAGKPDLRKPDLTQESVLGTPSYMAPEQRDHPSEVDHRADIFSLGVVLYEMLTGELPGSKLQPPSKKVQIDVRLDEIVLRALDAKPELRFHTATEFRQQVEGVVNTPPPTSLGSGEPVTQFIPRSTRCHVTTPQEIATLSGQFFLWRNVGQLVLDDRQLTVTRGAMVFAIPLTAIRDLSVGRYPVIVNPLGLHFLSVTYETNGRLETLYFSPHESWVSVPTQFNEFVATWFDAIRDRIIAATGQAPTRLTVKAIGWPTNFGLVEALSAFMLLAITIALPLFFLGTQSVVGGSRSEHFWRTVLIIAAMWPVICVLSVAGLILSEVYNKIVQARIRRHAADNEHSGGASSDAASMDPTAREPIVTEKAARSPQPPAIIWSIPPWFLVFLTTLVGFAMSLKNASGMRTTGEAVLFVIGISGLAFGWGWVIAWVMSRENRRALAMRQQVRENKPPHGETREGSVPAESSSPSPTDRRPLAGRRLFALALALGFVVIGYLALLSGHAGQMLTSELYYTLFLLFPYMIVGLVAAVASRRGTVVGLCALLTGVVVVAGINSFGYLAAHEAVEKHAWTGAALTQGLYALAAIPAALVSSLVGVVIGLLIVRSRKSRSDDPNSPHGAESPLNDPLANERSQRHKIAFAASVVWLVTGMVLGTVTLRATEVRFHYDLAWLARTLFLLATGVLVSKSLKQWCGKRDPQDRSSIFDWLRATAVLGVVMTLPFAWFTTGALIGLFSHDLVWGGWIIAFLLPMGLIGFVALPWASVVLWQARSRMSGVANDPQVDVARRRNNRRLVIGTITAMLVVAGLVIAIPTGSPTMGVTCRDAMVENGHFSFGYTVPSVPGWNVWLSVETFEVAKTDSPKVGDPGPVMLSRVQAKLEGRGRLRVPLEHLPTSDKGLRNLRASLPDEDAAKFSMTSSRRICLLNYNNESFKHVEAVLVMVPEGESPDSMSLKYGGPRYTTIEPLPKPQLGPFEGAYDQGKVELIALGMHPPKDQPHWKPNGEPLLDSNVPEVGGNSWSSKNIIREIVLRVHSETGHPSWPVLRFTPNPGFSGMGSSIHPPSDQQPYVTFVGTIACSPDARQMTMEVGVADGEWRTSLTFERHLNQLQHGAISSGHNGNWQGSVRTTRITGDTLPLAFSYSRRADYETRLAYERADGTIVPLKGEGSDGGQDVTNSITTLPLAEYESIRKFHVQSRRYQWIEFRNVSLELGRRTSVEVRYTN